MVPVYSHNGHYEFLLIQHRNKSKHRAFPKGHKEKGEDNLTAAKREFQEETAIDSNLLHIEKVWKGKTRYSFFAFWIRKPVDKVVEYFLGYLETKPVVRVQKEELLDSVWLPYDQALKQLSYKVDQDMLRSVAEFLDLS
ncbi:MAG: NUDIX domain-containing protein [bacterium]|nr:NUDIX domain-containing protein [bacterium]